MLSAPIGRTGSEREYRAVEMDFNLEGSVCDEEGIRAEKKTASFDKGLLILLSIDQAVVPLANLR